MLEFALWPLWGLLKPRLKSLADKKFSVMGGQFKALLSSTLDDLIVAMQKNFFSTDTWKHLGKDYCEPGEMTKTLSHSKPFRLMR